MSNDESTTGVQSLIDRLSQEGVAEGQRQAETIVREAQQKADDTIETARREAAQILERARQEAAQLKSSGEESLRLAARDTMREFGSRIHDGFRKRLQELVHEELQDPNLIQQLIVEVARGSVENVGNQSINILLPTEIVQEEDVKRQIAAGDDDVLNAFIRGLIGEDLREGVTVNFGGRQQTGLTIQVENENLEIDLSDDAITELLSNHLLPRFRAILRHA